LGRPRLPYGVSSSGRGSFRHFALGCVNRALLLYLHLHANEIPRTDPLIQVDYMRVVDLAIGANKSDIRAVRVLIISERACKVGGSSPSPAIKHQNFRTAFLG
jgi:hypothetical protein